MVLELFLFDLQAYILDGILNIFFRIFYAYIFWLGIGFLVDIYIFTYIEQCLKGIRELVLFSIACKMGRKTEFHSMQFSKILQPTE